jgi:hypothetical protein
VIFITARKQTSTQIGKLIDNGMEGPLSTQPSQRTGLSYLPDNVLLSKEGSPALPASEPYDQNGPFFRCESEKIQAVLDARNVMSNTSPALRASVPDGSFRLSEQKAGDAVRLSQTIQELNKREPHHIFRVASTGKLTGNKGLSSARCRPRRSS